MSKFAWIAALVGAGCVASPSMAQTWTVQSERDAFDDRPTLTASVSGRGYAMGVRCKAELLEVLFMGGYVGDENASVRYRFDSGEVHSEVWDSATSREGLFADAPGEVARWMASGSRMAFEYEDFAGTPHQYNVSLAGSGTAIGRVLDACGVPRNDPRSLDDDIWRRAVIDIERLEKSVIDDLQERLLEHGFELTVTGRRDLATYRELSSFYATYWSACRNGATLSSSCDSWRSSLRYNSDSDYPKEPVDLLVEVMREGLPESQPQPAASTPSPGDGVITDPSWARAPTPEFPERALAQGIQQGTVLLQCTAAANGSLINCTIEGEDPDGAGFGQAALSAARRARLSPRTVDAAASGVPIRWMVSFGAPSAPTPQ